MLHRSTYQQADSGCDGTPWAPLCGGYVDHLAQWRHCSAVVPHTSSPVSKPSLHIPSYHDDCMQAPLLHCLHGRRLHLWICRQPSLLKIHEAPGRRVGDGEGEMDEGVTPTVPAVVCLPLTFAYSCRFEAHACAA